MGCLNSNKKVDPDYSNSLTKIESSKDGKEIEQVKVTTRIIEEEIEEQEENKKPNIKFIERITKVTTKKTVTKKRLTKKLIDTEEEEEYTDDEEEDEGGQISEANAFRMISEAGNEDKDNKIINPIFDDIKSEQPKLVALKRMSIFNIPNRIIIKTEEEEKLDSKAVQLNRQDVIDNKQTHEDNHFDNIAKPSIRKPAPFIQIKRTIREEEYDSEDSKKQNSENSSDEKDSDNEKDILIKPTFRRPAPFITVKNTIKENEEIDNDVVEDNEREIDDDNYHCVKTGGWTIHKKKILAPYIVRKTILEKINTEGMNLDDSNERENTFINPDYLERPNQAPINFEPSYPDDHYNFEPDFDPRPRDILLKTHDNTSSKIQEKFNLTTKEEQDNVNPIFNHDDNTKTNFYSSPLEYKMIVKIKETLNESDITSVHSDSDNDEKSSKFASNPLKENINTNFEKVIKENVKPPIKDPTKKKESTLIKIDTKYKTNDKKETKIDSKIEEGNEIDDLDPELNIQYNKKIETAKDDPNDKKEKGKGFIEKKKGKDTKTDSVIEEGNEIDDVDPEFNINSNKRIDTGVDSIQTEEKEKTKDKKLIENIENKEEIIRKNSYNTLPGELEIKYKKEEKIEETNFNSLQKTQNIKRRGRINKSCGRITKKVIFRQLESIEMWIEEETTISYDEITKKWIICPKSKPEIKLTKIQEIETIEKINQTIMNQNLYNENVAPINTNIIPFVFDLIVKKLAFVLTKGEINSKFMCDLNPEVKISFGDKSKIFNYSEKKNRSSVKNKESDLDDWQLNSPPVKDRSGDESDNYSKIEDFTIKLYNVNDKSEYSDRALSTPIKKQSLTVQHNKKIGPLRKVSDFSLSINKHPVSSKLKPLDINLVDTNISQIFIFDINECVFPLSHINLAREKVENNFIYVTVNQVEPNGDKFILGEGFISILSILELISQKYMVINIPIFYQVENIQIAYLKIKLPTDIPEEIEKKIRITQEEEQENSEIKKESIFTKKIVTIYEFRYYITIQTMTVILSRYNKKLISEIKDKSELLLSNKLPWEEVKKIISYEYDPNIIDESKYLILISSLNEIISESPLIDFYDTDTTKQMLKNIFTPFFYKKDLFDDDLESPENSPEIRPRRLPKTMNKFADTIPKEKKPILTETILQFFISVIEYYEEIIIFEEFSLEFIFMNFEKKFSIAKETYHKIMLQYLKYFQNKKKLKDSLELSPVNPPEQNPVFITNRNLMIKFMNIIKNTLAIFIKNIKQKTFNLFLIKRTFEFLKLKLSLNFLCFTSKPNKKGVSKYDFLLCFTDPKIIILILEILINYVKLGAALGYKSKIKFFESSDDVFLRNFFNFIFKNFRKDKKILNLVLLFLYELFYVLNGVHVFDILNIVNLKSLFTYFISRMKKISSKNFKNWIYFFTIISKVTKLIKNSSQDHLDFIVLDWKFIFDNITRLYMLSLDNYLKIPIESKISIREHSLELFTSSRYLNKKFAIQIQMLFFDMMNDFLLKPELIMVLYVERKSSFRKIFNQICFLCLLTFQDSHLIIAEKEMRRFYFKMLVTLMMILNQLRDNCDIDIVEEFKLSMKAIVPILSVKLIKLMTVENYLAVMIPKLKYLIDMNIFNDSNYFERKVTEMVNKLKLN